MPHTVLQSVKLEGKVCGTSGKLLNAAPSLIQKKGVIRWFIGILTSISLVRDSVTYMSTKKQKHDLFSENVYAFYSVVGKIKKLSSVLYNISVTSIY